MKTPELTRYAPNTVKNGLHLRAECQPFFDGEYVRFVDVEAYTQAAIAAAMMGAVKPLEWVDADEGMCTKWRADALGGRYELVLLDNGDGLFSVNFCCGKLLSFWFIQGEPDEWGQTGPKKFPTIAAAKDAAQSDYQARILSALSIPADVMAALAERERLAEQRGLEQADERAARIVEALIVSPVRNQPEKWPDYLRSRKHGDELLEKRKATILAMEGDAP